jgi:hypothetical protein
MLDNDNEGIDMLNELNIDIQEKAWITEKIILVTYYLNFVNIIICLYAMIECLMIRE